MPRIYGVDIPGNKKVVFSLAYIYGIGRNNASDIVEQCGINPDKRANDLTDAEIAAITKAIDTGYQVEGDLRRQIAMAIRRLQAINCYRGIRHKRSLPVRGQRTKTNARTRKGKRKTIGAIRDKTARKSLK